MDIEPRSGSHSVQETEDPFAGLFDKPRSEQEKDSKAKLLAKELHNIDRRKKALRLEFVQAQLRQLEEREQKLVRHVRRSKMKEEVQKHALELGLEAPLQFKLEVEDRPVVQDNTLFKKEASRSRMRFIPVKPRPPPSQ